MESTSASAPEALLQTLTNRGWCFGDVDQVRALIVIQSALHGDSCSVDLIESELANMDLRSFGGKSLPDLFLLRKSSSLQGPKVLQISSVRDISRSSVSEKSAHSHRRLLRLILTDGHTEITAIEYSHIPSIPNDIVPGTKVRLENKAVIHSGILCLNARVITIMGGVVQSLYEEWQMNQKYSGFSRSSIRPSQDGDSGPPPFEKYQIKVQVPSYQLTQQGKVSSYSGSSSGSSGPSSVKKGGNAESRPMGRLQNHDVEVNGMESDMKSVSIVERTEEKMPSSEARPKEVAEYIPVQNQAAAQKLLQKMSQPSRDDRRSRGRNHKEKGKQEELPVLTLDEWERRKADPSPSMRNDLPSVSEDEELARQLQNQFDLEDLHSAQVSRGPHITEAENIRMSMFNFEREDVGAHGGKGPRGREKGRGKGRGRRRGRGRH